MEKCGVSNVIVTRREGVGFCKRWSEKIYKKFDKILVDAPCSGEGTLRKSPRTFDMWNINYIKKLSLIQKNLASEAFRLLKVDGEMVYSTCTHAPEENEEVVDFLKKKFDIKIEKIEIQLKTHEGILDWDGKSFDNEIKNCVRVYPNDNDADGFFLAKIKKLSEKGCEDEKF